MGFAFDLEIPNIGNYTTPYSCVLLKTLWKYMCTVSFIGTLVVKIGNKLLVKIWALLNQLWHFITKKDHAPINKFNVSPWVDVVCLTGSSCLVSKPKGNMVFVV